MPTYQYACKECGHQFEQVQSFTDDSLTDCPQCDGRLRKIYGSVGVVFKGSGFYRTDSRSGSSTSAKSSDKTSTEKASSETKSDSSSGSSESKSTSKPAAGDAKATKAS